MLETYIKQTYHINAFIIIIPETTKSTKNNETPFLCLRNSKFKLMRH